MQSSSFFSFYMGLKQLFWFGGVCDSTFRGIRCYMYNTHLLPFCDRKFCRITYGYSRIGAMWVSTFFKNWRYQFLNKEIWLLIQWCNSGCYFQNRKEGFFFANYLTVLMPFSINKIQKFCSFNIFQFLQSINSDYYK